MSTLPLLLNPFWLGRGKARAEPVDTSPQQRRALDFSSPKDNLYAFGKLWASYADTPVYSAFHGLMFAAIGDQRLQPLFGYSGIGNFQAKLLDNGNVRLRGKETGYFLDLASGQVLESWDNPWTGETVEVFSFLNDRVRGELCAEMPQFEFGDTNDLPTADFHACRRSGRGCAWVKVVFMERYSAACIRTRATMVLPTFRPSCWTIPRSTTPSTLSPAKTGTTAHRSVPGKRMRTGCRPKPARSRRDTTDYFNQTTYSPRIFAQRVSLCSKSTLMLKRNRR